MTCIQKRKRGRMENLDDKKAATFSTGYQSRHHKNSKPSNPEVFVRGSATGSMVLADLAKTCLRFNHELQTSIQKSKKKSWFPNYTTFVAGHQDHFLQVSRCASPGGLEDGKIQNKELVHPYPLRGPQLMCLFIEVPSFMHSITKIREGFKAGKKMLRN